MLNYLNQFRPSTAQLHRVSIGHLLSAPGTRLGDAAGSTAGGGLLAGLDGEGLAEVRDRAAHVREACTKTARSRSSSGYIRGAGIRSLDP
jgi:hypothetical protein